MRSGGIGLLLIGALIAVLGGIGAGEPAGALIAVVIGGFMFVAGAIFVASVGVQDAIDRRG